MGGVGALCDVRQFFLCNPFLLSGGNPMYQSAFGRLVVTFMVTLLCMLPFPGRAQSTTPPGVAVPQVPQGPQAKSPLLLQVVLPAATTVVGNLAHRFFNWLGEKLTTAAISVVDGSSAQGASNSTSQANLVANTSALSRTVYIPPPPVIPSNLRAATGIVYAIDRLGSDYSLMETVTPQSGVAPTFQSREKFAIRYTSNAPGVVVILNVDALQKTSYLGTFLIQPGKESRFPQALNKAMVLDDSVGLETYQMFFMACLPAQFAHMPDVIARRGQIPECGSTNQAEQLIQQAVNVRRAKGTFSEALLEADGSSKAVLSVSPYEYGDITVTTFTINHVGPAQRQEAPGPAPALPSTQPGVTGRI
jgi:hypothetical protein